MPDVKGENITPLERVGRVVRSRTAAVGASLLVGTAIGANLPREQQSAPEITPTPITSISEPPRPTQTPFEFRTPTPIKSAAPLPTQPPLETKTPLGTYEKSIQLEYLIQDLDGFFSDSFIGGQRGLHSIAYFDPYHLNKEPYLKDWNVFYYNQPDQESSWSITVQDPNKIADLGSTLQVYSKHDKKTNELIEQKSIIWANFDKVPELAAFTSKDKHGYFTLPQDKLRQFVEVSGIFDKAFLAKLKSFTWENYSKERAYDAGPETIQAVRASGKIGGSSVELTVDAQGVVVLRTTKG